MKFQNKGFLVEAITHASRPSSGVSCYQRLEFVGDAVLDHLITKHLFFTYTDLPPGRLTDLRAAAVNNENFARVAVKRKLHVHLRHGSSALETQVWRIYLLGSWKLHVCRTESFRLNLFSIFCEQF